MRYCTGRSIRDLKALYYKCSNCDYEVEIFSDEVKRKCPRCGKFVFARGASCLDWCPAAEECKKLMKDYRNKENKG